MNAGQEIMGYLCEVSEKLRYNHNNLTDSRITYLSGQRHAFLLSYAIAMNIDMEEANDRLQEALTDRTERRMAEN